MQTRHWRISGFGELVKRGPVVEVFVTGGAWKQEVPVRALIDTGSPLTLVSQALVKALCPDAASLAAAQERGTIGLRVDFAGSPPFPGFHLLAAHIADIDQQAGYHVGIGRDVLSTFEFTYNGRTGWFSLELVG